MSGMPFIVFTGKSKDDPESRKLIRSHVMLGKNRGKSRKAKRKQAPAQDGPSKRSSISSDSPKDHSGSTSIIPIPSKVGTDWSFTQFPDTIEPSTLVDIINFSTIAKQVTVPLEVCTYFDKDDKTLFLPLTLDAACLHAAALGTLTYIGLMQYGGKQSSQDILRKYETSPHFTKALRLLRERLANGNEEIKISDATMLVVLALAIFARAVGDYEVARHHMEGLRRMVALRGGIVKLCGDEQRVKLVMEIMRCDLTIAIETGIPPIFFSPEDDEPESFIPFSEQISPSPTPGTIPIPEIHGPTSSFEDAVPENLHPSLNVNPLLRTTFLALRRFSLLINSITTGISSSTTPNPESKPIVEATLLHTMASTLYPLLHFHSIIPPPLTPSRTSNTLLRLNKSQNADLNQAIRLALIAFASQVFLEWPRVRMQYGEFGKEFKACILGLGSRQSSQMEAEKMSTDTISSSSLSSWLWLWVLILGASCLFPDSTSSFSSTSSTTDSPFPETDYKRQRDDDDEVDDQDANDVAWLHTHLRSAIQACGVQSWEQAKKELTNRFVWISIVLDEKGGQVWRSVSDAK